MKTLLLLSAFALAVPAGAGAQALSQLEGYAGAGASMAPLPPPEPERSEDPSSPTASFDFLVRPDAEHEPGAELFNPFRMADKAAGAQPKIPYLDLARAEAEAQGLDLALVLAVIQKESSFNPKAKSAVGAVGLMQLMPDTAKWLGLKDTSKLTTPAVNIKYGVKYLKMLWDEFATTAPADISEAEIKTKASQMAIAAYNAGQGNVRKYDDVPPFKETKNYVKKVTEYFAAYEELLAGLLS